MKKLLNIWVAILISISSLSASVESELISSMEKNIEQVVQILENKNLDKASKNAQLVEIVTPLFDFKLMAKLSLGKKQWNMLNSSERSEFVTLFSNRIKQSYLSKLEMYTDEKVNVGEAKRVKKRIYLSTFLVGAGEKKEVVYKYYQSKTNGWLIYDADVLGVSLIQTYRTQLKGAVESKGFNGLIDALSK